MGSFKKFNHKEDVLQVRPKVQHAYWKRDKDEEIDIEFKITQNSVISKIDLSQVQIRELIKYLLDVTIRGYY
jgi:hypothetical protein